MRLSILIPYYRSDPCPLLAQLIPLIRGSGARTDVVLLDDGSCDASLNDRVVEALQRLQGRRRLLVQTANLGRSVARNRLAAAAAAEHVLLLDSDMLPERPDYLARHLALAAADVAVAFAGFTVEAGPIPEPLALHRAIQAGQECPSASRRSLQPARYVFTSNLLVRRSLLLREPFDEAFAGWGWEDVEWGLRIARHTVVVQIDNPARHTGLDTAGGLVAKYEQSPANFARLLHLHPTGAKIFGSYHAARCLKVLPRRRAWRPLLRALVLNPNAPLPVRLLAVRLYRAALYADVV